jgi:hypothetical protein
MDSKEKLFLAYILMSSIAYCRELRLHSVSTMFNSLVLGKTEVFFGFVSHTAGLPRHNNKERPPPEMKCEK